MSELVGGKCGRTPCRRIRYYMRLGVSCLIPELGIPCGSAFSLVEPGRTGFRYYMRLGVSCLILDLGYYSGSAFSVGALDLRWIPVGSRLEALGSAIGSALGSPVGYALDPRWIRVGSPVGSRFDPGWIPV